MQIVGTRFGDIEIDESKEISVPKGLIGFGNATRYVLLEPRGKAPVGWLQSLEVPPLAFPVIDGFRLAGYPEPPAAELAKEAGLDGEEVAILVVVSARPGEGLLANLLAPIVVDLKSRTGMQVVLDPKRFSPTVAIGGLVSSSEGNA